jgi:riboflavin synthase
MFTGIVQGLCRVASVLDEAGLRRLEVDLGASAQGLQLGASVAINGTCLTVTGTTGDLARFDVIAESLANTNLGGLQPNDLVNAERSFHVGDEVGGHILSGHVIGKVRVAEIGGAGNNDTVVWFDCDAVWMKYLHHKGFVALNGASLTISAVDHERSRIAISLIPETLQRTTFGSIQVGDWANLEVDAQTQAVVETVERVLASPEWRERLV